jgi:hypothetical protein
MVDELETALDDLDGLLEAYRALGDDRRSLRGNADDRRQLQREVAAAADAYAATLIASAGGDLTGERIRKGRGEAQARMDGAVARQKELAALVGQQRLPAPRIREDVKQLVTLSLQCRAALAALTASPGIDASLAEGLANKVLVELREATLTYLARARDSDELDGAQARAAVVALLEKTGPHVAELAKLEPQAPEPSAPSRNVLVKDVNALVHKTAREWGLGGEQRDATP